MKKLVSLLLAALLCLSLAACGKKVDKQPAIDAYNRAATALNEVITIINNDQETYGQYNDMMAEVIETLTECGNTLNGSDDLDQATVDKLVEQCNQLEALAADVLADMQG